MNQYNENISLSIKVYLKRTPGPPFALTAIFRSGRGHALHAATIQLEVWWPIETHHDLLKPCSFVSFFSHKGFYVPPTMPLESEKITLQVAIQPTKKTGPSLALSSQEWRGTISIPAQRVASRGTIKKCTNQLESQLLKESTWYLFRCLVDKRDVEFSILDPFSRSASSKAPMKKPS